MPPSVLGLGAQRRLRKLGTSLAYAVNEPSLRYFAQQIAAELQQASPPPPATDPVAEYIARRGVTKCPTRHATGSATFTPEEKLK